MRLPRSRRSSALTGASVRAKRRSRSGRILPTRPTTCINCSAQSRQPSAHARWKPISIPSATTVSMRRHLPHGSSSPRDRISSRRSPARSARSKVHCMAARRVPLSTWCSTSALPSVQKPSSARNWIEASASWASDIASIACATRGQMSLPRPPSSSIRAAAIGSCTSSREASNGPRCACCGNASRSGDSTRTSSSTPHCCCMA